ncbi:type II toxin-antitoxin system HicA family toxin [bacterium 210820-DFI.6.37]|nr:type II toxin-antitoxin system HicA family toxin [bacterium 210820-DFI.6.37]
MPMTPREMIKFLKKNGFAEVSQKGSHVKLVNEHTGKQTIVPYHNKAMKKGLEQAILKQAGLDK